MTLLQTSTVTNQPINTLLLVGTYTATRPVNATVIIMGTDAPAIWCYSRQPGGAGVVYTSEEWTSTAFQTTNTVVSMHPIPLSTGDVLKVYFFGTESDVTIDSITCEFWDLSTISTGIGAIDWSNDLVVTVSGAPKDGVEVSISTDAAGVNVVASGVTNTYGKLTSLYLDAGTYYVWKQLAGVNFTNPQSMEVA